MYLLQRFTLTVFFSLIALSCFSQNRTLEGIVTDENNKPLSDITVTAKGTDLSTKTDKNGYYLLQSVPDTILTLTFEYSGMQTVSSSIGIYDKIDVQMASEGSDFMTEVSLEYLLNMEVTTASKTAQKSSDAPGAISILSQDDIARYGGVTLKDLLERIPGLIGSTVYMTDRSMIASRGDQVPASSSHVLLLINGRPVRESLEGGIKSEMYETFPVGIIKRIEVVRGPGSVLYGSNAFSAVINVITKEVNETAVNISGLAGIPGNYGASADAMIKAGDIEFIIAGKYLKKQDWKTEWQYADPASSSGMTELEVTIPDEGKSLYMGLGYKKTSLMASYNEWENYYYIPDYAFIFPAHGNGNWKKGFVDIGQGLRVTRDWDMDFNVTYTRSTFKTQNWPNTNRDSYELVGE